MWLRSQDQTYYCQIEGARHKLGRDKQAAEVEYHRLMNDRLSGVPLGTRTVREVLNDYWKWLQANRATATVAGRENVLKAFGLSIPASLRVRDLRPFHVQRWIDGHTWGPTTRHGRITIIQIAINWGVKMGYAAYSPGRLRILVPQLLARLHNCRSAKLFRGPTGAMLLRRQRLLRRQGDWMKI